MKKLLYKIGGWYRNSGMKERLYAAILLAAFLPFVLIIFLLWQYCSHVFVDSIWQSAKDSMGSREYQIQMYVDELLDLSDTLSKDGPLAGFTEGGGNPSYLSYLLNQRFRTLLPVPVMNLEGIYVLSEDMSEYLILFDEEQTHLSLRGEGRSKYFAMFDAAAESIQNGTVVTSFFSRGDREWLGMAVPWVPEEMPEDPSSAIILLVNRKTLSEIVPQSTSDDLPWAFCLTSEGEDLFRSSTFDRLTDGGEVITSSIGRANWDLSCVINSTIIRREAFRRFGGMLLVVILMYVILVILVTRMMNHQHRTLQRLRDEMARIGDDGIYREASLPHEREVAALFSSYNEMVRRIENQEKIILEQNRKNLEIAEKQKVAELKAMEMEINPHYLYNTLNTINSVAVEHGDFQVSRLLKGYSSTLLYMLKDRFKPATVQEEVKWLREYLLLQQERFPGLFIYEIDAEPELMDARIYKLLVQPFVENAILHGFEGMEEDGFLSILFYEDEGQIVISIWDNGKGIEEEELMYLRRIARNPMEQDSSHIGILNSCRRMYGYYGDAWRMEIESARGKGTRIEIHLPCIKEE